MYTGNSWVGGICLSFLDDFVVYLRSNSTIVIQIRELNYLLLKQQMGLIGNEVHK